MEAKRGELLSKQSGSSLEIEELKKYLSLMEKTHSLLIEFMATIKEGELGEREGDKIKSLLKEMESSVCQIGHTAQHIVNIANKNQKKHSE